MAPKTYSRLKKSTSPEATKVLSRLFEKNRSLCDNTELNNSDKSFFNPNYTLKVKINNTFDDLFNSTKYRSVEYTKNLSKLAFDSSNSLIKRSLRTQDVKIPKINQGVIKKRLRNKSASSKKFLKTVENLSSFLDSDSFVLKEIKPTKKALKSTKNKKCAPKSDPKLLSDDQSQKQNGGKENKVPKSVQNPHKVTRKLTRTKKVDPKVLDPSQKHDLNDPSDPKVTDLFQNDPKSAQVPKSVDKSPKNSRKRVTRAVSDPKVSEPSQKQIPSGLKNTEVSKNEVPDKSNPTKSVDNSPKVSQKRVTRAISDTKVSEPSQKQVPSDSKSAQVSKNEVLDNREAPVSVVNSPKVTQKKLRASESSQKSAPSVVSDSKVPIGRKSAEVLDREDAPKSLDKSPKMTRQSTRTKTQPKHKKSSKNEPILRDLSNQSVPNSPKSTRQSTRTHTKRKRLRNSQKTLSNSESDDRDIEVIDLTESPNSDRSSGDAKTIKKVATANNHLNATPIRRTRQSTRRKLTPKRPKLSTGTPRFRRTTRMGTKVGHSHKTPLKRRTTQNCVQEDPKRDVLKPIVLLEKLGDDKKLHCPKVTFEDSSVILVDSFRENSGVSNALATPRLDFLQESSILCERLICNTSDNLKVPNHSFLKTKFKNFMCSTPLKPDLQKDVVKSDLQPVVLLENISDVKGSNGKPRKTLKINDEVQIHDCSSITFRKKYSRKDDDDNVEIISPQRIVLPGGKKYRRSLYSLKNESLICNLSAEDQLDNFTEQSRNRCTLFKCNVKNNNINRNTRQSIKIIKINHNSEDVNQNTKNLRKKSGYSSKNFNEKTESLFNDFTKLSLDFNEEKTSKDIVLEYCNQTEPILFDELYSERTLKKCRKIGEGVYGEVFMYKNSLGKCVVMKVIPIEGSQLVNGEHQKKYDEIISEIIISTKLSNLRNDNNYKCDGFVELVNVSLVCGRYPKHLIDLWELYDEIKGSENDSPIIFNDDQLYIVLELGNGGEDLEAYHFKNAEMAYSLFLQLACTLAIGEKSYEFEHRDLHWGNILISTTEKNEQSYKLNGREYNLDTKGIKLTIIDFTLSRLTLNNVCIFNDLSMDPDLFLATGDYQFEIYRLMKDKLNNLWQTFEPYTNVLWLDYVLDKLLTECHYIETKTKIHKDYLKKLKLFKNSCKNFQSVFDFLNCELFNNVFL